MDTTHKLGLGVHVGVLAALAASPAAAIDLRVMVPEVKAQAAVVVSVYSDPLAFRRGDKPLATATVKPQGGRVDVRFKGLQYGAYALSAFQDLDGDGRLKTLFGFPREPVGFSRGAKAWYGRPSFDQASFVLTETETTTAFVRLR